MKNLYLLLLVFIYTTPLFAQEREVLRKFLDTPELKYASIGICVRDMLGKEILSFNKDKSLTPASILKVITTATSLEILGGKYRYVTHLALDKNNQNRLIVHGYGDPTLGSEHVSGIPRSFLSEWILQIKNTLKSPPTEILVVDNYFGYLGTSEKWLREDLGNYFAAGAYGISIFDNTYRLYLNSIKNENPPQIVRTEPSMKSIKFQNNLKINTTGQDNGYIWGEPFSNYRQLEGDIPAKKSSFSIKGDIPDPGLFLAQTLSESLISANIKIDKFGTSRNDFFLNINIPDESIFYTHHSQSLEDIICIINVKSNNHYAEHIIRTIGREHTTDIYTNPLHEGISLTKKTWQDKGINTNGLFMFDGSGLAPSNAVNASLMCDILAYMYNRSKYSQQFVASLPKAGEEGTVQNFLKGTKLAGKVFVKSGSIANVQCYAGYYINGDQKYVFTVMVNNFNSSRRNTVRAIETLLNDIFY